MDHALTQLRTELHEIVVADAIKNHAIVDVVTDDPDIRVTHQHVGQRGNLVLAVDHAGRIGRIVEQEYLGSGQCRIQLSRGQLVMLIGRTGQQLRLEIQDLGEVQIRGPVRNRKHNDVTRIQQQLAQVVQHMLGTNAGGDAPARVAFKPTLLQMLEEGIQQRIRTTV